MTTALRARRKRRAADSSSTGTESIDAITDELHDEAELALAQQRLDRADDSKLPVDFQPSADLKRLLAAQMPRRDHLVTAA